MKTEEIRKALKATECHIGEILDPKWKDGETPGVIDAITEALAKLTAIETALAAKDEAIRMMLEVFGVRDGEPSHEMYVEICAREKAEAALTPPTGKDPDAS